MPEENINNDQLNVEENITNSSSSTQIAEEKAPNKSSLLLKNKKSLVLMVLVITIVLLIVAGIFLYLNQQKKQEISKSTDNRSVSLTKTQTQIPDNTLEPPELYPEFNWVKVTEDDPNSLKKGSIDNTTLYSNSDPIDYEISGDEYYYETTISNEMDTNETINSFEKYYIDYFIDNNWSISKKYNDIKLSAIAAGGPSGNMIGYIQISGDKLREVVIFDNNGAFAREDNNCPCNVSFNVFVSDIINLEELLKRIGE